MKRNTHGSDRQLHQAEADNDDLTGLPTFYEFRQFLKCRLAQQLPLSILICDVDNFRLINEIHGSAIADIFLAEVAGCVKRVLKPDEYIARKGGDEFIVIIASHSLHTISQKAKEILRCLSKPFYIENHIIRSSMSIGVSRYPDDANNIEELLGHADLVLNQSKKTGKNSFQVFLSKKASKTRYLRQLQAELPHALLRKEFVIFYQPQVDVCNQEVFGAEAVLRWKHPKLGMIKPTVFIPLLEKSNLIVEVGEWILQQACLQAQSWQAIKPGFKIAVNISVKQLTTRYPYHHRQLAACIKKALKKSNLAPELLELEITEGFINHEDARTKKNIKQLHSLGVSIACDDFGIAYSSFNRIKQLPLSTIKIDRSLIEGLLTGSIDRTIIQAIISIGKQLNTKVVAEGVTTLEQIHDLQHLNCTRMQGYYFSKPVSAATFTRRLKQGFHL